MASEWLLRCTSYWMHISTSVAILSILLSIISSSLVECIHQNSSTPLCLHCANGDPLGSLVVKSPQSDCISGHYYAVASTDHCHCDLVCARESRQACRLSLPSLDLRTTNQTLCDESLSLQCNEATSLCEGMLTTLTKSKLHQAIRTQYLFPRPSTSLDNSHSPSIVLR